MLQGQWIGFEAPTHIYVVIEGKKEYLNSTVSQVERFEAHAKTNAEKNSKTTSFKEQLLDAAEIAEIALNPDPDPSKKRFPKEKILELMGLDQINYLANKWVKCKFYQNFSDENPTQAPQSKGQ